MRIAEHCRVLLRTQGYSLVAYPYCTTRTELALISVMPLQKPPIGSLTGTISYVVLNSQQANQPQRMLIWKS